MTGSNEQSSNSDFITESLELLDTVEPDLLAMENFDTEIPPEAINRVLRSIHSVKGLSGFAGLKAVTELTHLMETLITKIKDGEMIPDSAIIDSLLAGVDKVRIMLKSPRESNEVSYKDELERLKTILSEFGIEPEEPAKSRPDAQLQASFSYAGPDIIRIELNLATKSEAKSVEFQAQKQDLLSLGGMLLYAIRVSLKNDLKAKERTTEEFLTQMKSFGQCLDSDLHDLGHAEFEKGIEKDLACHCLFATIMESELVGMAMEIPDEQIFTLDKDMLETFLSGKDQKHPIPQAESPSSHQTTSVPEKKGGVVDKSSPAETIRVNVEILDTLMNLAGELVLGRNQLRQMLESSGYDNPKLGSFIKTLDLLTTEIQERIMQTRMQPIGKIFNRFNRVVRDLSHQLSKEVQIFIEGEGVELDKSIIEGLSDPLTHLIRNCIDHGFEDPDERLQLGKPRVGKIHLKAFHEGGQINISVADDGRGINTAKLVEKAMTNDFLSQEEAAVITEKEKLNLIFLPGLSTAKAVTDISGRGVGMDVVKTNIERLGGHAEIDSVVGEGTTVYIRLPLTLTIIDSLIVTEGKQRFAIPLVNVRELVCIQAGNASQKIEKVGSVDVLRLRERLLPLVRLADILGLKRTFVHPETSNEMIDQRVRIADRRQNNSKITSNKKQQVEKTAEKRHPSLERRQRRQGDIFVVVLDVRGNSFGLIVNDLIDMEEIVVKSLSDHIKECRCFAGCTIMGDGRVIMILDAPGIADLAQLHFGEISAEERHRQEEKAHTQQKKDSGNQQSVIIFNNAPEEYFALRLDEVSRLQMVDSETISRIGKQEFITYDGEGLPLIRLENFIPVAPLPEDVKELFVILPKMNNLKTGILASRIVDSIKIDERVQKNESTPPGVLGSAVVRDKLTLFLDVQELFKRFAKKADKMTKKNVQR
ncbi:MAG: chemotaxis protein CheW [Thermodesulfobacteriota bacterium]|nr:chemotaxis protein CheW [Thermodesulfobacteriota bacterium]